MQQLVGVDDAALLDELLVERSHLRSAGISKHQQAPEGIKRDWRAPEKNLLLVSSPSERIRKIQKVPGGDLRLASFWQSASAP